MRGKDPVKVYTRQWSGGKDQRKVYKHRNMRGKDSVKVYTRQWSAGKDPVIGFSYFWIVYHTLQ